jgi:exopolysaccharide production protein ExoZ
MSSIATLPRVEPREEAATSKLDGLQVGRAVAALTVVIGHAVDHAHHHAINMAWQLGARYGVTLFFVISGFIMMATTGSGSFDPRRFVSRRVRRVVPIYWLVTFLVAGLAIVAPNLFARTVFDPVHFLQSLFFVPAVDPAEPGNISPIFRLGWTLNYEMFFYAVFAAAFALSAVRRALVITVFFAACIVLGQLIEFQAAIPDFYTRIDTLGFVAGVWLGLAHLQGGFKPSPALIGALAVVSLAILGVIGANYPAVRDVPATQVWLVAACAAHVALLILLVDRRGWRAPRPLLLVGDASYSMYLFHMFAIGAATAVARKLPPAFMTPMIVVSALSGIAIGIAAYLAIERPINRRMRRRRALTADQLDEAAPTPPAGARPPGT